MVLIKNTHLWFPGLLPISLARLPFKLSSLITGLPISIWFPAIHTADRVVIVHILCRSFLSSVASHCTKNKTQSPSHCLQDAMWSGVWTSPQPYPVSIPLVHLVSVILAFGTHQSRTGQTLSSLRAFALTVLTAWKVLSLAAHMTTLFSLVRSQPNCFLPPLRQLLLPCPGCFLGWNVVLYTKRLWV